MLRIPVEEFPISRYEDHQVVNAWNWLMSYLSKEDWQKRKAEIEKKMAIKFKSNKPFSEPLSEGTLLVEKTDVIGWYLYLVETLIHEPHKYEYFQGARVIPIFKRFGADLEMLKGIAGIEKRVKDLLKKRRSEADALIFEILTALLWTKNGYKVTFLEEAKTGKTPDMIAEKNSEKWHIECKRQSKTADYTYKETLKRQSMISSISESLIRNNIVLDIIFHVELDSLPDSYLKDLLEKKIEGALPGLIVSNPEVDIKLSYVDIDAIKKHLDNFHVKCPSPMLNTLIDERSVDNKGFTSGVYANYFRVGDGDVNNIYIIDLSNAYGVFWSCDAKEAVWAKARDIKNQINSAIEQFGSDMQAVLHVGLETFDGPDVEMQRFKKISETIEKIDPASTNLKWIFCHFFQAYSPPDQTWVFDETVDTISPYYKKAPPIQYRHLIIPEEVEMIEDISHWFRPLP